jgi:hypothetical protein
MARQSLHTSGLAIRLFLELDRHVDRGLVSPAEGLGLTGDQVNDVIVKILLPL